MVITLDTAGIAKLHGGGNGVDGFGASSRGSTYPDADNIDITAGFISDDAGNVSTTDGKDNAVISYVDAANAGAPTLLSFTTDATTGSFGVGDTINITANTSEPIVKGSSITVTLNSGSNATAVLTAAANGTTMTGTYTVLNGHSNADLAIASYAITSPVTDLYGNVMTAEIADLPSNSNLNGVTLSIDGGPPRTRFLALNTILR